VSGCGRKATKRVARPSGVLAEGFSFASVKFADMGTSSSGDPQRAIAPRNSPTSSRLSVAKPTDVAICRGAEGDLN